jgi:aspartyl-tRNA(Asn)/glutamyl-tRNA(Gln) amidotransferase subunit C
MAALARLKIEPKDEARYASELDAILGYVAQLQELDVSAIEPTSQVTQGVAQELRADEVCVFDARAEALDQAPERDGDYFTVPRVV